MGHFDGDERVPDAVQRLDDAPLSRDLNLDGPRISSAARRKEAALCAASGARNDS